MCVSHLLPHEILPESLIERARSLIGKATYRGNATLDEAPSVVNCFRFTQWVWCNAGITLPDKQLTCPMVRIVEIDRLVAADLVFVPRRNKTVETDDFGHVGIATGENTVIHATKWRDTVVEDSLELFLSRGLLGVRRVTLPCCELTAR